MLLQSCRCRKEPPPPSAGGGYGALVGAIREAGLPTTTTCEQDAWPEEKQREHRAMSAKMNARFGEDDASKASVAELSKLDDQRLVSLLRTRVFDKVVDHGTRGLSRTERALWFYDELDGEVNNGGFHQYFSNSSGDCALQALEALRTIGGKELLDLYERALAVFPSSRPAEDRETRNEQMSRIPNEFEAWRTHDDAYYAMKDRDRVVAAFLRAHVAEIDAPPSR
jgi:hypothetical protein